VYERVVTAVAEHMRADRQLRRNLPGGGRLFLDRALPFLIVYRQPLGRLDEGTSELAEACSAYMVTSGEERFLEGAGNVARAVADAARARHGAFLLVEIWSTHERGAELPAPAAVVVTGAESHLATATLLVASLKALVLTPEMGGDLGVPDRLTSVEVASRENASAPDLPPLINPEPKEHIYGIGLELSPFYRDPLTGAAFPRVVQSLRRSLAVALSDALFGFAEGETSLDPPHARALGRATAERAAQLVDRRLSEVFGAFDPLLQVTPVNSEEAWDSFRAGGMSSPPTLRYQPLPIDPELLKRRLFHVPIERVESPLLAYLFREKLEELDRQITLVRDVGTDRFYHASAELHGTPDDALVALARRILDRHPAGDALNERDDYAESTASDRNRFVDARTFARRAREEIDRYRIQLPSFLATVEIRRGVAAGVMVSKEVLLVSEHLRVPQERVSALLNHEIGTHLVTYFNGAAQPLRIFASGLAGYDPLQEGIAVLAEYLVGGLNIPRARVLAGRVLAVRALVDGADFMETFRVLHDELGFKPRTAFMMTVRVHRGGGLTKDAAYLQGLRDLLEHLNHATSVDPLMIGKVGLAHRDVLRELMLTGVLRLPVVRPFYMSDLAAMERLGACRKMDVMDLVEELPA
jgi:uncharacterized protein (TIGR02421 family)